MPSMNRPLHAASAKGNSDLAHDYKRRAGAYIRSLREERGLTQAQVAAHLGKVFTFVSSLETGYANIPPEQYEPLIEILGADPHEFALQMCRWSNPWLFMLLFPEQRKTVEKELASFKTRASHVHKGPRV